MHGLEIGSAGQVAFATRGEPAWHNLGEVFAQDEHVTTTDMLKRAHLYGWDVRLEPVTLSGRAEREWFEVQRTNPFDQGTDTLGVVGERYKVFQNEALFAFGDNILDGGGFWESAGSIKGGTQVFGSLAIDREVIVGAGSADDAVKTYLLVVTSHNGTTAVQALVTPVRVVCQNTLGMALGQRTKQSFKIRHTAKADERVAVARQALGLTHSYLDAFEAEAAALYAVEVTKQTFDRIIEAAYPKPEKDVKGALTKWESKRDLLMGLWESKASGPATMTNITGTAWGALNALTERVDWYRMPRQRAGQDAPNVASTFAAASGFDPVTNVEKNRLRSIVREFAGLKG